jgi:hypothetical protein
MAEGKRRGLNGIWSGSRLGGTSVTETPMSAGRILKKLGGALFFSGMVCLAAWADDPKPKPENTVHVELA